MNLFLIIAGWPSRADKQCSVCQVNRVVVTQFRRLDETDHHTVNVCTAVCEERNYPSYWEEERRPALGLHLALYTQ